MKIVLSIAAGGAIGSVSFEGLEEEQLGLEVRVHVLMIIEMILRQVGEDGAVEIDAGDAVLFEGV